MDNHEFEDLGKKMQDIVDNLKFSGIFIVKDISYNDQINAKHLLES